MMSIICMVRKYTWGHVKQAGSELGDSDVIQLNSKFELSNHDKDKSQDNFQSRTMLCNTREQLVKREENDIHQHKTTSLYIDIVLHPQMFYHASMYSPSILLWSDTPPSTLKLSLITPQHPMLQHFLHHPHTTLIFADKFHASTYFPFLSSIFYLLIPKWMVFISFIPSPNFVYPLMNVSAASQSPFHRTPISLGDNSIPLIWSRSSETLFKESGFFGVLFINTI